MMSDKTIAFVFPGQGSQQVGMLAAAHEKFSNVRDTFTEASETLGYDMWALIQNGPQESLNLTENTQPVLLASSVALWRTWLEESETRPDIMAGHSLGEFSALVCAGALDFSDALRLVRKRGKFMQTAVPVGQGAMAAILGVDDATIVNICAEVTQRMVSTVSAVNFNSPGQVVIAGHTTAVEAAVSALKAAGAKKAIPLPVSAPFHTQLMKPAGDCLAEEIAQIRISPPRVPVVHNVHAATEQDPKEIRKLLVEQIYSPVLWTQCVQTMIDAGVQHVIECGPGKVLNGLLRRIDNSLQCYSLDEPAALTAAAMELG
jgi:[acyl-carrier-protein] S-malonyltransferase